MPPPGISRPPLPPSSSSHPSPSPSPHPLSPSAHHLPLPKRSSSFTLFPPQSSSSLPTSHVDGDYFASTGTHRQHAATVSSGTMRTQPALDLLGVGGGGRSRDGSPTRQSGAASKKSTPSIRHDPIFEDLNLSDTFAEAGLSRGSVLEERFDQMSDEQLAAYLSSWSLAATRPPPSPSEPPTPRSHPARLEQQQQPDSDDPLFPPSPPRGPSAIVADHPLRVLCREVRELRDEVERLREENRQLRMGRRPPKRKEADQVSIHNDLTEALSTSLTSPTSQVPPPPTARPIASSLRSTSPTPSTRTTASIPRPRSPASSISVPFPFPIDPISGSTPSNLTPKDKDKEPRDRTRSSWTGGLWVWNKRSTPAQVQGGGRPRKGSIGSVSSFGGAGTPSRGVGKQAATQDTGGLPDEEDEEAWRRGDGGSPPGFRAIFLATRILTPDPSSILVSSAIPSTSLVAYLAHALVSTARDEGITVREDTRRRSQDRQQSRSRAASNASSRSIPIGTSDAERDNSKGYGDQMLGMGRSLISATVKGAKGIASLASDVDVPAPAPAPSTTTRPSLLSRASSFRPSLAVTTATATSPPTLVAASMPSYRASPSGQATPTFVDDMPSTEMASIVPDEVRPPTALLSRRNVGAFFRSASFAARAEGDIAEAGGRDGQRGRSKGMKTATRFEGSEPPLTDRYGFIYDIQHASMLKDASDAGAIAPASLNGTIPGLPAEEAEGEGWIDRHRRRSQETHRPGPSRRSTDSADRLVLPSSPRAPVDYASSVRSGMSGHTSTTPPTSRPTSMIDGKERIPGRHRGSTASGLPNLNPSPARPSTAKDTLTISSRGASSLVASPLSPTQPQLPTTPGHSRTPTLLSSTSATRDASRQTVSSLLDRLTELHDRQQAALVADWDAFLRKRDKTRQKDGGLGLVGLGEMGREGKRGEEQAKELTRLVRRGIPLVYRSEVWAECSGAKDRMVPGEYREILARHEGEQSPVLGEIEKDVGRTFPGNVFFGGDGPGVAKLRRVLVAYSWHNPAIGYCQGMNMLAATLLLTHTDEEQAYWTFLSMLDHHLPSQFFSPSLLASRADQLVLAELATQVLPKLSAHLEELGVELASLTFGWWLSLFTDCLPVETLFRVWDVFFLEGHDTLFRVALAILKLSEPEILGCESVSDVFEGMGGVTSRLWAADKLIALQHSYKPLVRHQEIKAKFKNHCEELQTLDGGRS